MMINELLNLKYVGSEIEITPGNSTPICGAYTPNCGAS